MAFCGKCQLRCTPKCFKITLCCCVLSGVSFVILAIMTLGNFTHIIEERIKEAFIIRKCTEAGDRFEAPPYSTLVYVNVFNVTNPSDVNNGRGVPNLMEVGPFVYRLTKRKLVYDWNTEEETITYREKHLYHFQPELSIGDPKDFTIYHVNAPDVGIADYVEAVSGLASWLPLGNVVSYFLGPLVIKHQANELLFDGYRIPIFDKVDTVVNLPKNIPNNTFGVFYGRNNTLGNRITVQTGARGIRTLGNIVEYNNSRSLPYWVEDSTCNILHGTDGTFFAPFITKGEPLFAFSPELCRTVKVVYQNSGTFQGIEVDRYKIPNDTSFNSTENICYCREDRLEKCAKNGLLVVRTCLDGAPVAMSPPHFFMSDPMYVDQFTGLSPDPRKHDSFADIERLTGLVLRGKRKLQINIEITPHQNIAFLKNATMRFFPLIWVNEEGEIDDERSSEFRWRLTYPITYGPLILKLVVCMGVLLILIPSLAAIILIKRARSQRFGKKQQKKENLQISAVPNGIQKTKTDESRLQKELNSRTPPNEYH